ncbi:hypothetical protein PHYBLDRAFT_73978 [Phycomyces blakesleeanus NRRL 1555(-)]|uniref:Ndc10 domain-containing protein n=1 Tax=Phycomyces blakesleeanus (strain ATCC 8743b / DSM 1359 / FGSC 10004 / NBRC 33097 / NRRL 1555) TaxID=763407 RepID=A0A167M6A3_PHYB8|nr:hypothetical protein PHYBLDRAFT_73978 [Phycomyces blakesleeanus NRRL 1555(-)]OAD71927.1 hypothetical protein PHYBLDRAFT_73978 [Phycomyces blakesleeanus NRRL 1555(-)]|eukprot:XP_018289967.1 hypothetical protein PHYBLDRAFT_73978 [Phycomyces blakesleeanus NRRL 1555(-)]
MNYTEASSSTQTNVLNNEYYQCNMENWLTMQQNSEMIVTKNQLFRSKNTIHAYLAKQKEWMNWCVETKKIADGTIVSDEKVAFFLTDFVMVCDRKFKRNDDDTPVPFGRESIQAYVKAITDIYYQQVALDLNKNLHSREPIVRQFLDTNTKKETKCKRVEYKDREKNTLNNRYTKNELLLLSQYFLEQDSTVGVRNHLCFLMSHAMLLRSKTAFGT